MTTIKHISIKNFNLLETVSEKNLIYSMQKISNQYKGTLLQTSCDSLKSVKHIHDICDIFKILNKLY